MMRGLLFASSALLFLGACDCPQTDAGQSLGAAANPTGSGLQKEPQEQLGEIKDKVARDRAAALEGQADAAEHRADAIKTGADQKGTRQKNARTASGEAHAKLRQADALREKKP